MASTSDLSPAQRGCRRGDQNLNRNYDASPVEGQNVGTCLAEGKMKEERGKVQTFTFISLMSQLICFEDLVIFF